MSKRTESEQADYDEWVLKVNAEDGDEAAQEKLDNYSPDYPDFVEELRIRKRALELYAEEQAKVKHDPDACGCGVPMCDECSHAYGVWWEVYMTHNNWDEFVRLSPKGSIPDFVLKMHEEEQRKKAGL
jgi:hypothetical protein